MNSVILACSMMEDEINAAYRDANCNFPIVWVERGYHNDPDQLRKKLQELIDAHQDCDTILLAFGLCGNGTLGLISPHAALILPRFDDCINLMLCDGEPRCSRAPTQTGCMYYTQGWTKDGRTLLHQYLEFAEEYDEETAADLMEMMYGHYHTLAVIDTGAYDTAPVLSHIKEAGDKLGLSRKLVPGSYRILTKLFSGEWDRSFIRISPGEAVTTDMFRL